MAIPGLLLPFQAEHYAGVEVNWSDASGDNIINIPTGSLLLGVYVIVDVTFDGTSPTLTVGRNASGDTTYFTNAQAALGTGATATTAVKTMAPTTPVYAMAATEQIFATWTKATGSPTKGHAFVIAAYTPLSITGLGQPTSTASPVLKP